MIDRQSNRRYPCLPTSLSPLYSVKYRLNPLESIPERRRNLRRLRDRRRKNNGVPLLLSIDKKAVFQATLVALCKALNGDRPEFRVSSMNVPLRMLVDLCSMLEWNNYVLDHDVLAISLSVARHRRRKLVQRTDRELVNCGSLRPA
jgi:hypothetical protein